MADPLPSHGRLNAKNPYVGFFKHAPRGQDPYANRVLEGQHTPEADIIRARALRRSVYSGTFHTGPGQYKGLHGRYLPKSHFFNSPNITTTTTTSHTNSTRGSQTEPHPHNASSRSSSLSATNEQYLGSETIPSNTSTTSTTMSIPHHMLRISTSNLNASPHTTDSKDRLSHDLRNGISIDTPSASSTSFMNRLRNVKTAIGDLNTVTYGSNNTTTNRNQDDQDGVNESGTTESRETSSSMVSTPLSDTHASHSPATHTTNTMFSLQFPSRRQSLPSSPMMTSLLLSGRTPHETQGVESGNSSKTKRNPSIASSLPPLHSPSHSGIPSSVSHHPHRISVTSPHSPGLRSTIPSSTIVSPPPPVSFTTIGKGKVTGDNASLFLDPLNNFSSLMGLLTTAVPPNSTSSSSASSVSSSAPVHTDNKTITVPSAIHASPVSTSSAVPTASILHGGDAYDYRLPNILSASSPVIRSTSVDYSIIEPLQSVVTIGRHSIKKSTRSSMDENDTGTTTDVRFLPTSSPIIEPTIPSVLPSPLTELNESFSSDLSVDALSSSLTDQYGELSPYHFVSTSWLSGGGIGPSSTAVPEMDDSVSVPTLSSHSSVNINPAVPVAASSIIGRHTQVTTNSIASYGSAVTNDDGPTTNHIIPSVPSVSSIASKDTNTNPRTLTAVSSLPTLPPLTIPESINLSFHPDIFTTELEAVSPLVGKHRLKMYSSKQLRNLSTGTSMNSSIPEHGDDDAEETDASTADNEEETNGNGSDGKEGFAFTIGSPATTNPKPIDAPKSTVSTTDASTTTNSTPLLLPPSVGARNTAITDDYEIGKIIGEGGYAQVRTGMRKDNRPFPSSSGITVPLSSANGISSSSLSMVNNSTTAMTVTALESYYHSNPNSSAVSINAAPVTIPTQVVIKCIRKRFLISEEERDSVAREVVIHRGLDAHPRIVTLYDVYEQTNDTSNENGSNLSIAKAPDSTRSTASTFSSSSVPPNFGNNLVCLILEYVPGGTLAEYMRAKSVRAFSEWQARLIMDNLLEALEYLHGRGILHGDVKPSNLLIAESVLNTIENITTGTTITNTTNTAHRRQTSGFSLSGAPLVSYIDGVKLCDFGNARRSRDARYYRITGDVSLVPYTSISGTVGYIAPEILQRQPYGTPADIWSCGIILYELLAGYAPFHPYSLCLTTQPSFNHPPWTSNSISTEAVALCKAMLTMDTHKRITAHTARAHPWFSEGKV